MVRCLFLFMLMHVVQVSSSAQTLYVEPAEALADTEVTIRVTGLESGQPVIIRSAMDDAQGDTWRAHGVFVADQQGAINLYTQAPEDGTYTDVDPMGLIHSMEPPAGTDAYRRFSLRLAEPLTIRFSLEVNSEEVDTVESLRWAVSPEVDVVDVRADGIVGRYYKPPGEGPFPAVLVLGGSGGGFSGAAKAGLLASNGLAVLTVAYFDEDGVPSDLKNIPLEYFKKGIDWLSAQHHVAPGGVAVYGTSKGAEAALLVGAHYPEVRSVVGVVPSSVAWGCICNDRSASWSFNGEPIPFAITRADPAYQPEPGEPFRAATRYLQGLGYPEEVEVARIPVEKINGPILLVSGTDDQLWPSYAMSEMIMEWLDMNQFPHPHKHLAIEGAGHAIRSMILPLAGTTTTRNGRLSMGGSYEGTRRSQSSWEEIISFLKNGM